MNQGSLFQPLGGLFSRFERGGTGPCYVVGCPAVSVPHAPAHAAPYIADARLSWRYLVRYLRAGA